VTCVVCYDDCNPAHGVACGEGHFLCGHGEVDGCLSGHVLARADALRGTDRLAAQAEAAEAAGDTRRVTELGGAVHCPVPGCGAAALTDVSIARHAAEAVVAEYVGAKTLLPIACETARVFEQAQVEPGRHCSPRHPSHFHASILELNGIP